MAHALFRDIQIPASAVEVRKIGFQDLWQSLREGYADFSANPSFVVFLLLIYPFFAVLWSLLFVGQNLDYLVFPVVAGLTLLGPVVATALCEMSRRREAGEDVDGYSAFEFVHSAAFAPIVALSILMMALYVAWVYMAELIYFGLFGADPMPALSELAGELLTTRRGAALLMYGFGVGFLFAFVALACSAFSFSLLLDKPASALTALGASVRGVTANPIVMCAWGLIVAVLLALGAAVFLIGLAAVLPVLGHATWHLYRKVVER